MADESANLASEVARAAIDLSVSATTTGFTVSLKIDNTVLAGIISVGALSLGAFYLANRRPVEHAIRNGLENRNEAGMVDPEVRTIEQGSIFVELYCHSERSFLQFVEDFEAKKVEKRLEEEFTKIGFQQNLQVTIRNADEVNKKVKVIRLSRERIDTKEVEDIPSAPSKKRLKDMSTEGHQMLCLLLQPKAALGNDYRLLAAKMGYTDDYIKYLGTINEPVKELIKDYEKGDRKIVELESVLKDIERYDVVEDLQNYIEATPTPEEIEQRVQNRETIQELKTSRESYDAFICFAEKDREFVDKLVKKMESAPYNLHLCLSARDFVPGGSIYETTAVAIEQRCKKFVVILSRNFDDSEGSHYESHISMNFSPGAKQKRLIPVLIEEAYRYKIPRTISHIVYLDYLRQEENNFWNLLAHSLGWKPK